MSDWFNQRYVARDEHQQIVAFYRKVIAHLSCTIRDLRAESRSGGDASAIPDDPQPLEEHTPDDHAETDNVVWLDFRRRR
ncbi:hypothetical protein [Rhizobium sp. Root708]|uniref:hypothetical protein n=1 Tax=Rhizobium sp. Root708 TaxID=1736592 RepID=UPI0012E38D43|nr:hypothetical protein [Rhizobium sp. Root708]